MLKSSRFLVGLIVACAFLPLNLPLHAALYDRRIVAPEAENGRLKAAVGDLQTALQEMTAQPFAIEREYAGEGIYLMRSAQPQAPADMVASLRGKGREPFIIRSGGEEQLWIVANDDDGLAHGIYYYLEKLGVRYLLPNPNWTIIPRRNDVTLKIDELQAPAFRSRSFFGTGGFGPPSPVDAKVQMRDQWNNWHRRNRFGGEYTLGGHSGEAFNLENKAVLQQHPEYLAKVDGKHVPWSLSAKLNTANPDAVQLFTDWSLKRFREARRRNPHAFAVSVDPADGGGHCNSDECRQIGNGSVSDQVFYVANQVAKAVRAEFSDGFVSLYAYNQHGKTPSFELEPNIAVMVIPYAFNYTGLSAQELIDAWRKKTPNLSLYDYWGITDWSHSQPDFNYLQTPEQKIRYWHAQKIDGFNGESTYSAGAMGIGQYIASRLLWKPDTAVQPLLDEFYELAFGPARVPMQRMLERWSGNYMMTRLELGLTFRDLEEAQKLAAGNPAVQKRVDDYANYAQYLRLYYEQKKVAKDAARLEQARRKIIEHIWNIYDSTMVHTFREFQFLIRQNSLGDEFNIAKKDAPGWQRIAAPTHAQVLETVALGRRDYPVLEFDSRSYSDDLVALNPEIRPTGAWSRWLSVTRQLPGTFQVLPGVQEIALRVRWGVLTKEPARADEIKLLVHDAAGQEVAVAGNLLTQPEEGIFEISVPVKPGRYRFTLTVPGNYDVAVPGGVPLVVHSFQTWRWGASLSNVYFYVPKNHKKIAMYAPINYLHNIINGEAKPVTYHKDDFLLIDVPQGQDGSVWALVGYVVPSGNYRPRTYNIPAAFSLFADTMMVPRELSSGN